MNELTDSREVIKTLLTTIADRDRLDYEDIENIYIYLSEYLALLEQ